LESRIKKSLSILLPLALGFGLTLWSYNSFTDSQLAQMKNYFVSADYNYVILSLVFALSGYILRAYRWKYTLEQINCKPNFKLNFLAVSIGYFVNLSVPRAGEVSRALIIKKYQNQPFDKVFGTIISERIFDFIILLLFIASAVIIEFQTLKDFLLEYIPVEKLIILAVIAVIGFLLMLYFYFYSKLSFILKVKSKIQGLKEGVLSVFQMKNKVPFLVYTILIWVSYVLTFYAATFTLQETSGISLGTCLVAFVIGSLTITFTNGGFGFFPILIAKILVLYNIPIEAGNAFGWIIWTSQLIITVVLGIFSFLAVPFIIKNK
jgi:uncharacterized protein (TIRG00374 family)